MEIYLVGVYGIMARPRRQGVRVDTDEEWLELLALLQQGESGN